MDSYRIIFQTHNKNFMIGNISLFPKTKISLSTETIMENNGKYMEKDMGSGNAIDDYVIQLTRKNDMA